MERGFKNDYGGFTYCYVRFGFKINENSIVKVINESKQKFFEELDTPLL